MNNTTRILIFLAIVGAAFGAWAIYRGQGGAVPTVTVSTGDTALPQRAGGAQPGAAPPGTGTALVLVTSATKKDWLKPEVDWYNATRGGNVSITYLESRDALQGILNGKNTPNLWSPTATLWANRLSEAWATKHGGEPLVSAADPKEYRVYLRTPLVFVTTKDKVAALRPLLSGAQAWENLADLASGRKKLPGATRPFVWAHADPLKSNSGFLTLGLLLDAYARKAGVAADSQAAGSPGFAAFLIDAEKTMPLNDSVRAGSTQLLADFVGNPGRYDVIATYESSALGAAQTNPNVAVIYPMPTAVSEEAVVVLDGAWNTAAQKTEAAKLLAFLGEDESVRAGVTDRFRPAQEAATISLAPQLEQHQAQGFQTAFTPADLPSYDALNDAAGTWNRIIGHRK